MVGRAKGHQIQICSCYPPEMALELRRLAATTRITLAVFLREAAEDLLRKYAAVLSARTPAAGESDGQ